MTNAEARCNKSLRPRKPEGSLVRTAQDGHLDSHTAPELCLELGRNQVLPTCLYTSLNCQRPYRRPRGMPPAPAPAAAAAALAAALFWAAMAAAISRAGLMLLLLLPLLMGQGMGMTLLLLQLASVLDMAPATTQVQQSYSYAETPSLPHLLPHRYSKSTATLRHRHCLTCYHTGTAKLQLR